MNIVARKPNDVKATAGDFRERTGGGDRSRGLSPYHPHYTQETSACAHDFFTALDAAGARFCRVHPPSASVRNPGKQPIGANWQNRPYRFADAERHHQRQGESIGLLGGHGNIGLLDVDERLRDFCRQYPDLAGAPFLGRDNAPDKGKLIIKITGEMVVSQKWRREPEESPYLEWLSTGNQGVIIGLHPSGAPYALYNAGAPVPELSAAELDQVIRGWTYDGSGLRQFAPPPARVDAPAGQSPAYNPGDTDPDELREVERRTRLESAARLVKRGRRAGYYACPKPHGPGGKDFLFNIEPDKPIGGCQGKHAGQLTRWVDLAAHLGIDVSQIAADVARDRRSAEGGEATAYHKTRRRAWFARTLAEALGVPPNADMTTFDARYVPDAGLDLAPQAVIRSDFGTGKTELINHLIAGLEPTDRALVVVHRRALAAQLAARLEDAVNYEDLTDKRTMRDWRVLVVCANSLHYLLKNGLLPDYRLVVFEESEALAEHLDGGTFTALEETNTLAILRALVRQTLAAGGRVLALDAGASRLTHELLTLLAGTPPRWYINSYRVERPRLVLHESKAEALGIAEATLASGERVYLCSDHKSEARAFAQQYPGRAILVCLESDDKSDVLAHLDRDFAETGLICASPTVDAGVDIQTPAVVVGLFHGTSNSLPSIWQQLGRVRNPVGDIHVFFQERHERRDVLDYKPDAVEKRNRQTTARLIRHTVLCDGAAPGELVEHPAQIVASRLRALVEARDNLIGRDWRGAFKLVAAALGYAIEEQPPLNRVIYDLEGTETRRRDALKAVREADRALLLTARPINNDAYRGLLAQGRAGAEHHAGNLRWRLERIFGCELTDELADEAEAHDYPGAVHRYHLLCRDLADLTNRDREDVRTLAAFDAGPALEKLRLRAATRRVWTYLMRAAFGGSGDIAEAKAWQWTEAELEAGGFMDAINAQAPAVRRTLGIRPRQFDQKHMAQSIMRSLLRWAGLRVTGRQIMRDGARFYMYAVDLASIGRMTELADNLAAALAGEGDYSKLDSSAEEKKPILSKPHQQGAQSAPSRWNSGSLEALLTGLERQKAARGRMAEVCA